MRSPRRLSLAALLLLLGACAGTIPSPSASVSTDLARASLSPRAGRAAAEGGTQGGARARPEHVFTVANRAELMAALALGTTPKIIQLRGRIDLNVDDAGRPLTADAP